jgi:hypothetical protein
LTTSNLEYGEIQTICFCRFGVAFEVSSSIATGGIHCSAVVDDIGGVGEGKGEAEGAGVFVNCVLEAVGLEKYESIVLFAVLARFISLDWIGAKGSLIGSFAANPNNIIIKKTSSKKI